MFWSLIVWLLLLLSSSIVHCIAAVAATSNQHIFLGVNVARPIRVPTGRTVALTPEHLRINTPPSTPCKVVVVRGGAFSERVGKLQPGVFSCAFAANGDRVTYAHSGSPLLTNDTISLRIFAFFANSSLSPLIRDVTLQVEITARPNDKLVLFGASKSAVEVVLSGLSEDFDRLRMAFSYDIADNVSCTLFYNTSTPGLAFPAKGQLVDKFGKPLDHFAVDCWEFAFSGMRYRHQKPFSPDVDYIPLTARVVDGAVGRVVEQENVFIPVRVIGALENYPPQVSASSALKLVLKSPYLTLFTSEVLSFVDWDINDGSKLVVNISQPPALSLGYFVNLLRPTEPIHSFTVGDVDRKLIAFQPAPRAGSDTTGSGEAKFVAFDELFARSEQVTVQISLAYSSNSFPRARVRQSLYVLRGSLQPITTREIEFVAPSSSKETFKKPQIQRIFFEKPKCGRIFKKNKEASAFSLADLNNHLVVYNQTASNCSNDFIVVHIQDDFVELRLGVPVYIVPRATEPPRLVENKAFVVRQALQHVFNRQHLLAMPADNSTENRCRHCVTYRIVRMPKFGTLESSSNASLGSVLQTFTQADIDDGFIRYQHSGINIDKDELALRVEDDEQPEPNIGPEFMVSIQVRPYSPEKISVVLTNSNVATLNESDFLILSEKHLKYKYPATSDREIEYVVVKPPYFLENRQASDDPNKNLAIKLIPQRLGDAGKLVIFSSGNMPSRRSSEQIVSFTQSDVKDGRVAYFAPNGDIGSRARVAQFVFDVKGPEGVAKSQVFKINILPINNRPPRVHETTLVVKAGDSVGLLPALQVDDADSPLEKLTLAIEQTPKHGDLVVNGTNRLSLGDKILFEQLGQVTYQHHPHSADRTDQFRLMAFDGQYHASGTISVTIQQPDLLDKIFVPSVAVPENERANLTVPGVKEFIAARFPGPSSNKLKFLVVRAPTYGKLLLNDREVRKFYSRDLLTSQLVFAHPSHAESGFKTFEDSLTILGIATSADLLLDSHQLLLRTIAIKILPKDNRPPSIQVVGLPQILEGQSAVVDPSMLVVDDVDTPSEKLAISLVTAPKFGCLSLISNVSRGCLASGDSFYLHQFRQGGLLYNQTNSTGHESTSDSFDLQASDGLHLSDVKSMTVEILPETDEAPSIEVAQPQPVISEGGDIDLSQLFAVHDIDRPSENLTIIFTEMPKFGSISVQYDESADNTRFMTIGAEHLNKSITLQAYGKQPILLYQHDGSENLTDFFRVQASDGKLLSASTLITLKISQVDDEKPRLVQNGVDGDGEIFRMLPPSSSTSSSSSSNSRNNKIPLTSQDLKVEDLDTPPSEVVFTLVEKPLQFTLMLGNVMASSFSQRDVDEGRLSFMAPSGEFGPVVADSLRLSASSGSFSIAEINMTLRVVREKTLEVDVALNADNINSSLALPNNSRSVLEQFNAATLVFIPANSSGQDCFSFSDSSFSLEDVLAGRVLIVSGKDLKNEAIKPQSAADITCQQFLHMDLRHLPSKTTVGQFSVNFTSQPEPTTTTTTILMETSSTTSTTSSSSSAAPTTPLTTPELPIELITYEVDKKPGVIERLAKRVFGFVLSSEHLRTVSKLGATQRVLEDAIYEVSSDPTYGILADLSATSSSLDSLRSFTQLQVNQKQIVYVLTKLVNTMTNDSFGFSVLDGSTRRPIIEDVRFNVEWSFVEFEQDQLIGCEFDGHVMVPVRRVGFTNSSAVVHVRLKNHHNSHQDDDDGGGGGEEAEMHEEELKFEPGSTKLMLNVKLDAEQQQQHNHHHRQHEAMRSIRALLRSPVNTLLGSSRKISIRVIASNRAPCNGSRIQEVETLMMGSLTESRRVFNLRSKMFQPDEDDDGGNSKRSSRSNKSCQTGWMPFKNLAKTCYAQLPLATHYADANRRCKALGGRLPSAATLTPALLRELSELGAKKPIWIDAANSLVSKRSSGDATRSCAVIRNASVALRRCSVAKARVICITDL